MPDYETLETEGIRWRAVPGYRKTLHQVGADLAKDAVPSHWRSLKDSKRRQVYRAPIPGLGAVVVKRYPRKPGLPGTLKQWFPSRAGDEFKAARRFQELGVPVPEPVAFGERRVAGKCQEAFYVAAEIHGAAALGPSLEARYTAGDGNPWKHRSIVRGATHLCTLHEHGILHRDFHGGNVLVREAEGPAGQIWLIDVPLAVDLGHVAPELRAKDLADYLYSLRYVLDENEVRSVIHALPESAPPPEQTLRALHTKRRRGARSRSSRAIQGGSQFALEEVDGARVARDRLLDREEMQRLLNLHRDSMAAGSPSILRFGRKSCLTRHPSSACPEVVVKEYRGPNHGARGLRAWKGAAALRGRDIPTPRPLALVRATPSTFLLSEALTDTTPLHWRVFRGFSPDQLRSGAESLAQLFAGLIRHEVYHPDLSAKNLLVEERGTIQVVDWDGVQTLRRWTPRRISRALAQMGDLPAERVSRTTRVAFVRRFLELARCGGTTAWYLRHSARDLTRRRKIKDEALH